MKLNKKKELYVNAIIGGNAPSQKQGEKMVKTGLMVVSYEGGDFDIHDWVREALMKQKLKHLKELYAFLNK